MLSFSALLNPELLLAHGKPSVCVLSLWLLIQAVQTPGTRQDQVDPSGVKWLLQLLSFLLFLFILKFYWSIADLHWRRAWQLTPVFLPGESPWTEEPNVLQSMGSQSQTRLSD